MGLESRTLPQVELLLVGNSTPEVTRGIKGCMRCICAWQEPRQIHSSMKASLEHLVIFFILRVNNFGN